MNSYRGDSAMSDVKRYDCYGKDALGYDYSALSREAIDGDWVLAEDHIAECDALKARLAEALFLLNRWHEAYHADGGMEMLDDDTTTCLAGITVSAACEWCKPDARCPDHGAACIEDIEGVTDSAPTAPAGVYCKWCNTTSRPGEKVCPVCGGGDIAAATAEAVPE